MSLSIEIFTSDSGKCRIELSGRLDTATAGQLDQRLESLDQSSNTVQVVDLQKLDYISSAGLRSLFKAKKRANEHRGQFLIVHCQPQVKKVFDVVKAIPSEGIFASVAELDEYLDAIQKRAIAES